jgi:dihydroxyacid dehydratase/phosphogluconate dehydratase
MSSSNKKTSGQLRSYRWMGPDDLRVFGHRARMKQLGFSRKDWDGKPIIGILNTWSDLNTCHSHFRERAEDVKRGVLASRRFPGRSAGDVALGNVHETLGDVLSQHARDGS